MRPLDRLSSIKVKFSVVIIAAVAISAAMSTAGLYLGTPIWVRPVAAAGIGLLLVYPFARGMTSPLREMVQASKAMAEGDYSHPVTATSHDEVGELARAFNAMRAELAETERQRRDLIANVSHELRTPLSALQARMENLVDGVEPADEEALKSMLIQVERLGGLVHQLLDLSRLEAGTTPLHRADVVLRPLLERAVEEVRLAHPDLDVDLRCRPALTCRCDADRIHQVLSNVVGNAAGYSPADATVSVVAARDGGLVRITVDDNGPGIAADDRDRVFERFYRSDHARSSDRGGAGLGLAIARWIVDLHGGAITVGDRPDGCRIVIELPGDES